MDEKTKKKYLMCLKIKIDKAHRENKRYVRISVKDLEKLYAELKKLNLDD